MFNTSYYSFYFNILGFIFGVFLYFVYLVLLCGYMYCEINVLR